jgi:hypothetical protein
MDEAPGCVRGNSVGDIIAEEGAARLSSSGEDDASRDERPGVTEPVVDEGLAQCFMNGVSTGEVELEVAVADVELERGRDGDDGGGGGEPIANEHVVAHRGESRDGCMHVL